MDIRKCPGIVDNSCYSECKNLYRAIGHLEVLIELFHFKDNLVTRLKSEFQNQMYNQNLNFILKRHFVLNSNVIKRIY